MGTVAHHRAKARYFRHRIRIRATTAGGRPNTTPANPRTPSPCPRRCWKPPPCAAPPRL